jgi:HK97 family phage major capsid protein
MSPITMPALDELEGKIKQRNDELGLIFSEAGDDVDLRKVKVVAGDTSAKAAHIRKLNDELTDLGTQRNELKGVKQAAERIRVAGLSDENKPGTETGTEAPPAGQQQAKSVGRLFTESQAYKGRTGSTGPEAHLDVELKTLMTTSAGWAPETIRTGRVVDAATRPIQVIDLVPPGATDQAAVVYMVESTFTNSAAEASEGGTYAESAEAFTVTTNTVRKIATFLPVTDEQLDDVPMVESYLNQRLPFMLRQRLDGQILTGNGTPPNLTGFLNVAGISTQAKGADPSPDAVYKAMVKVQVTGRANPDGIVYHPTNWQDIRLLRTADGIYIWGNPSDAGPSRMWGLMVAQSDAITLGTALVGDFGTYTQLVTRRGIEVQVSNSHSTFFIEGKQALRADMRVALVVYRPAALCTVTGL